MNAQNSIFHLQMHCIHGFSSSLEGYLIGTVTKVLQK